VQWHPEFVRADDTHLLDDTPLRTEFLASVARRRATTPATDEVRAPEGAAAPCAS
jgi:hypothetical protein